MFDRNLGGVEVELTEPRDKEMSYRGSDKLSIPVKPLRRQSSLIMVDDGDQNTVREHRFEIIGDPGIAYTPGPNNINAYVHSIDFCKAPVQITIGMQLIRINNTELKDIGFDKIDDLYQTALNSENPMVIILVEPSRQENIYDLQSCPDVKVAEKWKTDMENEHWNKSLKARAVVFVDGLKFQIFIIFIILFDFTLFLVESYAIEPPTPAWIIDCTWVVMSIYMIEICVRIYGYGIKLFFRKKFCVIDFVVVLLCLVMQIIVQVSWASVLRGVRVTRMMLLFRAGARLFTGVHAHIPTAIRYKVRMNKMQFRGEFNLDLCYITKRIISMSVPSEGREKMYRNPIDKVVSFFEKMHKDKYMVYDLCEERSYDYSKFQGRVEPFKFTDHSVPTITKMLNFCLSVERWMNKDPENVIAVHCRGGKGRTGTMICAWLIFNYRNCGAQEAIDFFAKMRTNFSAGGKYQGIETSSQVRYVKYFWDFVHLYSANAQIFKTPFGFTIKSIRIGPFYPKSLDNFHKWELEIFERSEIKKEHDIDITKKPSMKDAWSSLSNVSAVALDFFTEYHERCSTFNSVTSKSIAEKLENNANFPFFIEMEPSSENELFKGNLRVDFFGYPNKVLGSDKKNRKWLVSFWISTNLHPLPGMGKSLKLTKLKLDKVQKDVNNKKYPHDFHVEINACLSNNVIFDSYNRHSALKKASLKAANLSGLLGRSSRTASNASAPQSQIWEDAVHEL